MKSATSGRLGMQPEMMARLKSNHARSSFFVHRSSSKTKNDERRTRNAVLLALVAAALVAVPAAFPLRLMVFLFSAAGAGLLPAVRGGVDRCPGAPLRFLLVHAARFVAFLDVLGHPLLFVGIGALVSPWHSLLPEWCAGRRAARRSPSHRLSISPSRQACALRAEG